MKAPESGHLLRIISNPGGGCGIVEGDIGVGKTTLVGISATTARADIQVLIQREILQKQGNKRGAYYMRKKAF